MEIAGYSILVASPPTQDLIEDVKQSLHAKPKVHRGSFYYGKGNQAICRRLLWWGANENDVVCPLLKFMRLN
jgi:hypothetical protein